MTTHGRSRSTIAIIFVNLFFLFFFFFVIGKALREGFLTLIFSEQKRLVAQILLSNLRFQTTLAPTSCER